MTFTPGWSRERAFSLGAVALLHLGLAWALVAGLAYRVMPLSSDALRVFTVTVPEPPPPVPEIVPPPAPAAREGAAAPAGRRARPSPVVARPSPVPRPQPIRAAEKPAEGAAPSSGASTAGPGPGSGGVGTGTGAGGEGSGAGGVRARLRSGTIRNRDYPRAAWRARIEGAVTVRYTVGTDGRPRGCRVTRSSGNAELDSTTCRLIEARFRYEPARNAAGEPVEAQVGWRQSWWIEGGRDPDPE